MGSGGDKGFLGDYDMVANANFVLVVDPDALTEPTEIADLQIPRKLHAHSWAEQTSVTDSFAEQSEHRSSQMG
jgi:hypothetical protein